MKPFARVRVKSCLCERCYLYLVTRLAENDGLLFKIIATKRLSFFNSDSISDECFAASDSSYWKGMLNAIQSSPWTSFDWRFEKL